MCDDAKKGKTYRGRSGVREPDETSLSSPGFQGTKKKGANRPWARRPFFSLGFTRGSTDGCPNVRRGCPTVRGPEEKGVSRIPRGGKHPGGAQASVGPTKLFFGLASLAFVGQRGCPTVRGPGFFFVTEGYVRVT